MDAIYASTNSLSDIGNSDNVKDGKPDLPTHPGEKPSKVAHKKWAALWRAAFTTLGYGSFLRGELPAEIQLLADRTLLPEGDTPNPAIVAKNGDITYANAQNKIKRDALLIEYKNRAYAKLMPALESKAPLRLKRLKEKHQLKDSSSTPIPNSYDGIAMFLEEEADAESGTVSEYDESRFTLAYDKLKVKPLGSNISPDAFASRVNLFMTHVNPYLGDGELKGEGLSKFILKQLPEDLGSDVRSLRRELERLKELGTPSTVLGKAQKLVEDSFKPDKKAATDDGLHIVAVCLGYAAEKQVVQIAADGKVGGQDTALVAAEVKKAVAAAMHQTDGKQLSGRAKKQAAKRAAEAIAAATANADKPKLRNGIRLPPGERCSKGTCDFAHDRTNPDSPCYRDPRWGGPLPPKVSEEARARIIADRITEGKRLGITPKPLAPTVNLAAGDDATLGGSPALRELLAGAGYMLEGDGLDSLVDSQVDPESGYSLDGLASPEVGEIEDESGYTPAQLAGLAAAYKSIESPAPGATVNSSASLLFSTRGSSRPSAILESQSVRALLADEGAGCFPGSCQCAAPEPPVSASTVRSPLAEPVDTQKSPSQPKAAPTPLTQPPVKPAVKAAVPESPSEPELMCEDAVEDSLDTSRAKPTLVTPSRVSSFAESASSLLLAFVIVFTLGLSFYCAVNGPDGCHSAVMQLLSGMCLSQGGPGVARSFALMMAKREECAMLPPPPDVSVLQMAAACTALVYLSVCLAQHAMFTMLTHGVARLARGAVALVDPRAVARQGMTLLGLGATIFCLISMLPGVGSAAVTVGANETFVSRVHDISRAGMNLVPGDMGDRLRFVVDEVSMVHVGYACELLGNQKSGGGNYPVITR